EEAASETEAPRKLGPQRSVDGSDARPGWRDIAARSPRPLTPLEAALGTFVVGALADYRSMNEGPRADDTDDPYIQPSFEYRRRIERASLWTAFGAHARIRDGEPSYGAHVILYEDYDPLRLRVTASAFASVQRIEGATASSIQPRGFVEYSGRVAPDFFILPR